MVIEIEEDVAHPAWYTQGGIEVNDFLIAWENVLGWNLMNIIKYACRCNFKGQKVKDLKKIIQYATMELEREDV